MHLLQNNRILTEKQKQNKEIKKNPPQPSTPTNPKQNKQNQNETQQVKAAITLLCWSKYDEKTVYPCITWHCQVIKACYKTYKQTNPTKTLWTFSTKIHTTTEGKKNNSHQFACCTQWRKRWKYSRYALDTISFRSSQAGEQRFPQNPKENSEEIECNCHSAP